MGFLDKLTGASEFQDAADESSAGYAAAEDTIYQAGKESVNRFNPYADLGANGANALNSMYNSDGSFNYDTFRNMPGYQFRLQEGQRALDNSGAARGMNQSGAQMKALTRYGQGSADQGFNDWFNKQMAISGMGMNAVSNQGNIQMNAANQVGQMKIGGADARASGMIAKGGIKNGLFNTGIDAAMAMAGTPPSGGGSNTPQINQNSLNSAMGQPTSYAPGDARNQFYTPPSIPTYKPPGT